MEQVSADNLIYLSTHRSFAYLGILAAGCNILIFFIVSPLRGGERAGVNNKDCNVLVTVISFVELRDRDTGKQVS